MHKYLTAAALSCLLATPSLAQTATATGTGVGVANSKSQSGAVAISGQGGRGGNSSLTVNGTPAATSATVLNRTELTGTSTVKNVPAAYSPGLAAAGLETCLGSVSGGGSVVGFGASFGTTVPDPGCNARLDARTLWSMGLKKAALARLCLTPDIYRSMPEVCYRYMPVEAAPPTYAPVLLSANVASSSDTASYSGGPVEVVMRSTGAHRICSAYDTTTQRCKHWAK